MPRASVLLSVRLLFWRMRAVLVVAGLLVAAGGVAVPIRLADPAVAGLLRPGDRGDLVAPTGVDGWAGAEAAPATVLARGALVLEVLNRAAEDAGLLGGWGSACQHRRGTAPARGPGRPGGPDGCRRLGRRRGRTRDGAGRRSPRARGPEPGGRGRRPARRVGLRGDERVGRRIGRTARRGGRRTRGGSP